MTGHPNSSSCLWPVELKTCHKNLMFNAQEELDLLQKYLGTESSKHCLSLRAAKANNPERGLICIWEKLEERYGGQEITESNLKKKEA